MYIYNDIFDQFRSYRYLLYAYSIYVYAPYTVIPYIQGVKNPTGQLVEMERRDWENHNNTQKVVRTMIRNVMITMLTNKNDIGIREQTP